MAPTRELCLQIGKECRKFAKTLGLRAVCVYGGTGQSGGDGFTLLYSLSCTNIRASFRVLRTATIFQRRGRCGTGNAIELYAGK